MIKTRINLDTLEEKKKEFLKLIEKENIKENIKKVSQEEADELGKELYKTICTKGYKDNWQEAIKYVYEGANVNIRLSEGKDTPLLKCCRTNYPETVIMLIKAGADVNLTNNYGTTPLMSAARHNCKDILKMLLWMGADVNKRCKDGDTALISAYRHTSVTACDILIDYQANLTSKNVEGESMFTFINSPVTTRDYLEETKRKELTHEDAMQVVEEAQKKLNKIKEG